LKKRIVIAKHYKNGGQNGGQKINLRGIKNRRQSLIALPPTIYSPPSSFSRICSSTSMSFFGIRGLLTTLAVTLVVGRRKKREEQ
jgi:hypothetical protein